MSQPTIKFYLAAAIGLPDPDGDTLPTDIQWMPPGTTDVRPLIDGEWRSPRPVVTDEAVGKMVAAAVATMRGAAARGEGDWPYLDFGHEDGAASAEVLDAYWGGNDRKTGGVRLKVKWSAAGAAAISGKTYRRLSPQWLTSPDTTKPVGVPVNMGGLVNRAAFRDIQPIAAKGSQGHFMTEDETKQLTQAITAAIKPLEDRLTTLEGGLAGAKANDQGAARASALEITDLKARITAIEGGNKNAALAAAKAKVDAHVAAGRLAPQDQGAIDFWTQTIATNPASEVHLAKLPVNPALTLVAGGAGHAAGAVRTATPEGFVADYRAQVAAGKAPPAALGVAIDKNPEGYAAWRKANGQPGL